MGRPTKLTPAIQKAICDALEITVPDKYAAVGNDVDDRTFRLWMERGKKGHKPYDAFYAAVTRARARAVQNMHVKALSGGSGSSQATWFLERRFREDYGSIQRIEHAGHDGKAIEITARSVAEMTDEELFRLANGKGGSGN